MLQGKKVHFRLVDCCWQAKQSSCSKYPWVSCATPMAAVRGYTLMSLPGPVLRRKHGEKGMVHSRLCPQNMVSIPRQGPFLASSWQIWISGAYKLPRVTEAPPKKYPSMDHVFWVPAFHTRLQWLKVLFGQGASVLVNSNWSIRPALRPKPGLFFLWDL